MFVATRGLLAGSDEACMMAVASKAIRNLENADPPD
jgi:hypothetical protein